MIFKRFCLAVWILVELVVRGAAAGAEPAEPRLVVLLTIDQLRRDRLDGTLPGGLGRLVREGRVFSRAELAHAVAETCPGHAALATGRHPGAAGLPSNYHVDRASGEVLYCLEDEIEGAAVLSAVPPIGRSPRRMRVDSLGDWLQATQPEALVLSISPKDRSAIALGGQHPTAVFWLLKGDAIGFTTSRYYAPELPTWVRSWNGWSGGGEASPDLLSRVPERWVHQPEVSQAVDPRRPDDYAYESREGIERASAHELRGSSSQDSAARVYQSPYVDALTLDFALAAVDQLGLGDDEVPDLLAISLSGTDLVGHAFGPESHEALDALLRLDAWLADWLTALETRVGPGRLVVALSSDHGVLPIPEWLTENDRSRCPVRPGRISLTSLRQELRWHLHWELGRWYTWPRRWLGHAGLQMTVDRANAAAAGVEASDVIAAAEAWLEARPEVAGAWTGAELAASADPMARRHRRSYDPERSGDLVIQPAADCLISLFSAGTSHGAPYDYDIDVPIVFWGRAVEPGVDDRPAATVDIAPTLAHLLGITPPDDLDGASLLD